MEKQFNGYFHQPSNDLRGGITASIQAVAFAGSLLTDIFLADALGRKRTILCGATLFTIGIAISCASNTVECLIAGRVIHGLANGCSTMKVVTPKEIRGGVISLQYCVIDSGILSSFLIQYACSFINSNATQPIPIGLQAVPTITLVCVVCFLPESPRWLLARGMSADAMQVLPRVHANGDHDNLKVQAEYAEIKEKIERERTTEKPSYFALLFLEKYARRTYIGIGARFWHQAVGINSILYYAPFLFQQAGVGRSEASLLANAIEGVILNVVTFPNMYYLDIWGRRKPMVWGAIGMGACMLLIGVILKAEGDPSYSSTSHKVNFDFTSNQAAGKAVIAFLYLFVASFAISWATHLPGWCLWKSLQ